MRRDRRWRVNEGVTVCKITPLSRHFRCVILSCSGSWVVAVGRYVLVLGKWVASLYSTHPARHLPARQSSQRLILPQLQAITSLASDCRLLFFLPRATFPRAVFPVPQYYLNCRLSQCHEAAHRRSVNAVVAPFNC
jgi:hypothetical protein